MATETAIAAPAPPRVRPSDLRRFWRGVQEPPGILKRLEPVYYVFITIAIFGPLVYGTVSQALADVATGRAVAVWGPALALAGLLAVVRWGAVQGPVVFSVPDVAHLLGAPLRRADLALGRLVRALLVAAGAGAVLGGLILIGAAGDGRGIAVARGAGFVVALALLMVLGVAAAGLVQASARWDRGSRLLTWPLLAIAAGLVVAAGDGGTTGRRIAMWSGPWGWAIAPLEKAVRAWPLAIVLLAVLTAAATLLAFARRGSTPTERHLVRAEARQGALAAVYSMNARYVRRSLSSVGARPARAPRLFGLLPRPRDERWAVPWRDAAALLAAPQRLVEAVVLAVGGAALALVNGAHPAGVGLGALLLFFAGSRILEPLRAETDQPSRARVLYVAAMPRLLVAHAFVPIVVVATGTLLATLGVAALGALPAHGATAAVLLVLTAIPITLCAALSSRRGGQMSPSVMATATNDQTGMMLVLVLLWVILFPVIAAGITMVAIGVTVQNGTTGTPQLVAGLFAATAVLSISLAASRFAPG
ncbi:hypothetical protein [Conexibacter woesei]|uniref:hypothetical protein n=1 Tax=Conexibacter woesei TaxID=191495 RepID=UPI000416C039|nr:hypothetical protein [Conexibacter woesei]